jgi:hypothetical protein
MEKYHQQRIENVMNRALPDIAIYLILGIGCGIFLEKTMPRIDDMSNDGFTLLLEIFIQISILIFAFMLVEARAVGRYGIVVFIIAIVGSQPTLLAKINKLGMIITGENQNQIINRRKHLQLQQTHETRENNYNNQESHDSQEMYDSRETRETHETPETRETQEINGIKEMQESPYTGGSTSINLIPYN